MIWSYYIYVFTNLKLHDIVANIDRHVSCLLKKCTYPSIFFFFFFFKFLIVLLNFFPLFVGHGSIVAKTTKFE